MIVLDASALLALINAEPGWEVGEIEVLGITVSHFGRLDARLAASFYRHRSGLSFADRVCLALARSLSSPAYTTDRIWRDWSKDLGVDVQVIR